MMLPFGKFAKIGKLGEAVLHYGDDIVSAATPVGRMGSELRVLRGSNSSATIAGRQFSGHALDKMQSQGLVPSVVEDTILSGRRSVGRTGGTLVYYSTSNNVTVIVDAATGRVITTGYGRYGV
jgi:hypothetical protein